MYDATVAVASTSLLGVPRYREMVGRLSLHGHSADAQFDARYLVTHPQFLDQVVLSAPSTFPMPGAEIPWRNGVTWPV
jgi:hypothetical protein